MKKLTLLLSTLILLTLSTKAQKSTNMIKSASIIVVPVDISTNKAWNIIGAVDGVDKWFAPLITTCEVNGDTRVCGLENGVTFTESIILVDHTNMIFRYDIPSQPLIPMTNLSASMRVIAGADGKTYIEWAGNYDVKPEDKNEVNKMLLEAWETGIKGIEKHAASL